MDDRRFCPRRATPLTIVGDGPERHMSFGSCVFMKFDNLLPTRSV